MKSDQLNSDTTSTLCLTGMILLANLDYTGLIEYAIKAAMGGAIWMVFKLSGDWLGDVLKKKRSRKS